MAEVGRPKVLLVDAELRWVTRLSRELAASGLDVRACHDGGSALDAASAARPDVILLDSRMPGMHAYEACRRLRGDGYRGGVLIYSAYDASADIVLAHEAGADDGVSETVQLLVLVAKIHRAVRRAGDLGSRFARAGGARSIVS